MNMKKINGLKQMHYYTEEQGFEDVLCLVIGLVDGLLKLPRDLWCKALCPLATTHSVEAARHLY